MKRLTRSKKCNGCRTYPERVDYARQKCDLQGPVCNVCFDKWPGECSWPEHSEQSSATAQVEERLTRVIDGNGRWPCIRANLRKDDGEAIQVKWQLAGREPPSIKIWTAPFPSRSEPGVYRTYKYLAVESRYRWYLHVNDRPTEEARAGLQTQLSDRYRQLNLYLTPAPQTENSLSKNLIGRTELSARQRAIYE